MDKFEVNLKKVIQENGVKAEHLCFEQSCHSVDDAAKAANVDSEDFVKNICMIDSSGKLIVAIVKGEDRASTSRVAKALDLERPRLATPDEILEKTGFPCGGTPSFGYNAIFLMDPKVMEKEIVYSGGGSEKSLIKIPPRGMQKANNAQIVRVRK